MALNIESLNCWVEVSEKAYLHNLRLFSKLTGDNVQLSVVIKANAYGHGMQPIANMAAKHGVKLFCVHSLDEALELREARSNQDILIIGYIPFAHLEEAVKENFQFVVYNKESLLELINVAQGLGQTAHIHLKLETGFHRQGVDEKDLPWFLDKVNESPSVNIKAVYTHFADIDNSSGTNYTHYQLARLKGMLGTLKKAGFTNLKIHAAGSAAIFKSSETNFDMIRLGISQYGLWPSKKIYDLYRHRHPQEKDPLRPVLRWKTRVCQIKWVPVNNYIGYGCTYKTTRDTKIAVLPIGYADGYDRGLSNVGHVLIRGKRARILGRVCMNIVMADVTQIVDIHLEDEVVLLGNQSNDEITADSLADLTGTINYEIVTRINWNIPRIVVE